MTLLILVHCRQDHSNRGVVLADLLDGAYAVASGHVDVHQDDVGEQLGHPGDDLDAFGFSHSSTTPCLVTEWSWTTGHGLKSLYQLACSCALPPSDATGTVKYTDREGVSTAS
jgi:hypothetical protein